MSYLGKNWLIQNTDPQKPIVEKILENRGVKNLDQTTEYHDPFLFDDMEKALARIQKALDNNERIIIFGDYDVDGISGTALLVHIFQKLKAQISYRIPHRVNDGYGLTEKFIPDFVEKDIKLVITVDCGISCHEVILKAKEKGVDTIVTDHHHIPPQKPSAASAIIHPKLEDSSYPYDELTGSGVAFKLAHALILRHFPEDQHQDLLHTLVDLASLGTVADLGPLHGENRLIVKKGLDALAQTKWKGLRKIMDLAKVESNNIDTSTIGFRIGPRINAAGRIGNPYLALNLLLHESENKKTTQLSQKLEELNDERRALTEAAFEEAKTQITNQQEIPEILIAESPDWHVGIVGLVAGKLVEKFSRPSIIMQEFEDLYVASARSPEFFNVVEAIHHCKEFLTTYGGHAQAAGFSLKKQHLQEFKEKIHQYTKEKIKDLDLRPTLKIDCELHPEKIDFNLLNELDTLKPFGIANQTPSFLLRNIEPLFIDTVGATNKHLKFSLQLPEKELRVIAFNMGEFASDLRKHRKIDLAFRLQRNIWKNREYLQLQALDIRKNQE